LEEQRREVAKPADSGAALEAVAEQVAAAVATLRGARAADAPPDLVRPVLREMLEKVVVEFRHEPFGRRTRSVPTGGVMHLRGCCRPVTIALVIEQLTGRRLGDALSRLLASADAIYDSSTA
jgi:hypothetical protein